MVFHRQTKWEKAGVSRSSLSWPGGNPPSWWPVRPVRNRGGGHASIPSIASVAALIFVDEVEGPQTLTVQGEAVEAYVVNVAFPVRALRQILAAYKPGLLHGDDVPQALAQQIGRAVLNPLSELVAR